MSFLTRISARAAGPRATTGTALMPKGLRGVQSAAISRAQEEEDESLSPMRSIGARKVRRQEVEEPQEMDPEAQRQTEDEEQKDVAPLRRQEENLEEEVAPLRRQEEKTEEEVAPLRRQEESAEEEVAPLRRQEDEGEEEVAPLRRQETEEETEEDAEARPQRVIARQEEVPLEETGQTSPPRTQADLEPDAEPASPELAGETEPSDLQALRRDIATGLSQPVVPPRSQGETHSHQSGPGPETEPLNLPHAQVSQPANDLSVFQGVSQTSWPESSPPKVVIDQLDVLIHEPVPSQGRSARHGNHDRALRARYLRRL